VELCEALIKEANEGQDLREESNRSPEFDASAPLKAPTPVYF
jgi:hypothetical protein